MKETSMEMRRRDILVKLVELFSIDYREIFLDMEKALSSSRYTFSKKEVLRRDLENLRVYYEH